MRLLTSLILLGIFNQSFAQVDNLKTDTTRSVYNGIVTIKMKNKSDYRKIMAECRPCILLKYDNEDRLVRKAIQYTNCPVGYYIEYLPNGKVKLIGHYKNTKTKIETIFPT